ncbi:hypothetical protein CYMTET_50184, partial [Cymbomonas tetramitiformis]
LTKLLPDLVNRTLSIRGRCEASHSGCRLDGAHMHQILHTNQSNLTLDTLRLVNGNSTTNGGAVSATDSAVYLRNTVFSNNSAEDNGEIGCVAAPWVMGDEGDVVGPGTGGHWKKSETSGDGGAAYAHSEYDEVSVEICNSVISGNVAGDDSGAIMAKSFHDGHTRMGISGSVISHNTGRGFSTVNARMRSTSWEKQLGQILSWTRSNLTDLQLLPEEVRPHTDALLESELLSVDSSGAIAVGPWPTASGTWLARKRTEFDKLHKVTEWAKALLQLVASVPAAGTAGLSAGSAASGAPSASTGTAAPSRSAGASGPGGGVPAGTAGAAGIPGIGTVAAVGSAPATAVSPDVIAAAIASGLGMKLDDLGARLTSLEARGSAPADAALVSGRTVPVEAELLAQALKDSVATAEDWDMARCAQACADLVHEAAKLRPQLTLLKSIHPFGKLPIKALEAHAFPPMVYALPELTEGECELDELPVGKEVTVEHWRAFVHLLQARVAEFQRFVKSKVPSFPLTDVMPSTFFKKRKRVTFEGDEEEAWAAGGGRGLLPPLDTARREHLATLGSTFKTVNEDQLARALHGELAPVITCSRGNLNGGEVITSGSGRAAGATGVAEVVWRMLATATTRANAGINPIAISDMSAVCAGLRGIHEAPAGAVKDPVATPVPAVETAMVPAPVVETEIEGEDALVDVEETFGLTVMEDDAEVSPVLPSKAVPSERCDGLMQQSPPIRCQPCLGQMSANAGKPSNQGDSGAIAAYSNDGAGSVLTIRDSILANNAASNDGGAADCFSFYSTATISILDSVLSDNTAGCDGGAFDCYSYYNTAMVHLQNVTLNGNAAGCMGGAFIVHSITDGIVVADIQKCSLQRNAASGQGGAVAVISPSVSVSFLEVHNSTFSTNMAGGDGGVIFVDTGSASTESVQNATFSDNHAGDEGGALYLTSNAGPSNMDIRGSVFSGNTARSAGGAVYLQRFHMAMAVSQLTGNAAREGGAVKVFLGAMDLHNSFINDNSATNGGGLLADGSNATFSDSRVCGNVATISGGGMYTTECLSVGIARSLLCKNRAGNSGGAGVGYASALTMSATTVSNNEASGFGGGWAVVNGTLAWHAALVMGNSAGSGGSLYLHSGSSAGTAVVQGCIFNDSFAENDGGILAVLEGMQLSVEECELRLGYAGARGGAAYVRAARADFNRSRVHSCLASLQGGGVFAAEAGVHVEGSSFAGNTAVVGGGALWLDDASSATLWGSKVVGSTAQEGGGLAVLEGSNCSMSDCLVARNEAKVDGGGVLLYGDSGLELRNSTFSGNQAGDSGGSVHVHRCARSVFLEGTSFQRGSAGSMGGAVYFEYPNVRCAIELVNLTFANNTASLGAHNFWGLIDPDQPCGSDNASLVLAAPECTEGCAVSPEGGGPLFTTSAKEFVVLQGADVAPSPLACDSGEAIQPALTWAARDWYGQVVHLSEGSTYVTVLGGEQVVLGGGLQVGYEDGVGAAFTDLRVVGEPGSLINLTFQPQVSEWPDTTSVAQVAACVSGDVYSSKSETCLACQPGFIKFDASEEACSDCAGTGLRCFGGSRYELEDGHWMPGTDGLADCEQQDRSAECVLSRVYTCHPLKGCFSLGAPRENVNGSLHVDPETMCGPGYRQGSVLCSSCASGHFRDPAGACRQCSGSLFTILAQAAAFLLGLTAFAAALRAVVQWSRRHAIAVVLSGAGAAQRKAKPWHSMLAALAGNVQVIMQTMLIYPDDAVPSQYREGLQVLSFSFTHWLPVACVADALGKDGALWGGFYLEFSFYAIVPFATSLLLLLLSSWQSRRRRTHRARAEAMSRAVTSPRNLQLPEPRDRQRGTGSIVTAAAPVDSHIELQLPWADGRASAAASTFAGEAPTSAFEGDGPRRLAAPTPTGTGGWQHQPTDGRTTGGEHDDDKRDVDVADVAAVSGDGQSGGAGAWAQSRRPGSYAEAAECVASNRAEQSGCARASDLTSTSPAVVNVVLQIFSSIYLRLLIFLHPVCATYMFSLFSCRLIYHEHRQYWLEQDPSVECFTPRWWVFMSLSMVVILTYVLLLPCAMAVMLWRMTYMKQVRRRDTGVVVYVHQHELHQEVKREMQHWSSFCTTNPVYSPPDPATVWEEEAARVDSSAESHGTAIEGEEVNHYFIEPQMQTKVDVQPLYRSTVDGLVMETAHVDPARMIIWGSILLPFKREYYAWAAYDMLRKLATTSMVTMVNFVHRDYGLLYNGLATSAALALHTCLQPYKEDVVNKFQAAILLSQNVIVLLCIGERYEGHAVGSMVVGVAVILIQLSLCVTVVHYCISDVNNTYRQIAMEILVEAAQPAGKPVACVAALNARVEYISVQAVRLVLWVLLREVSDVQMLVMGNPALLTPLFANL